MKSLETLLRLNKQIRVIGFDDAPFKNLPHDYVNISGIVCSGTRFEGMLWGKITKDGLDATENLIQLLSTSKFIKQTHVILLDGIAFGGFNIIDLSQLSSTLKIPCIAVMRKLPDLTAIDNALKNLAHYEARKDLLLKAGTIYSHSVFHYQIAGCTPDIAAQVLAKLTDNGNVPEALRLAHLIGSAVMTGQSSNRA